MVHSPAATPVALTSEYHSACRLSGESAREVNDDSAGDGHRAEAETFTQSNLGYASDVLVI